MLTEEEIAHFLDESAMLGTTESFAFFASRSPLPRTLRSRVNSATLVGQDIEDFVERILMDYQVGRTFYADRILALVAQLASEGPEPFASRYLRELASLKSAELPLSPRVARRVLRQRELSFSETSVSEREFSDRLYGELGADYSSTVLPCDDACPDVSVITSPTLTWLD